MSSCHICCNPVKVAPHSSLSRPVCCNIMIILCRKCKKTLNYTSPTVFVKFQQLNNCKTCIHVRNQSAEVIYEQEDTQMSQPSPIKKSWKDIFFNKIGFKN